MLEIQRIIHTLAEEITELMKVLLTQPALSFSMPWLLSSDEKYKYPHTHEDRDI